MGFGISRGLRDRDDRRGLSARKRLGTQGTVGEGGNAPGREGKGSVVGIDRCR